MRCDGGCTLLCVSVCVRVRACVRAHRLKICASSSMQAMHFRGSGCGLCPVRLAWGAAEGVWVVLGTWSSESPSLDTYSRRYLFAVEAGYQKNPYHNTTHAADMLQTLHGEPRFSTFDCIELPLAV